MFAWGPCSRLGSPRHCLPACKTMKARRLTDTLSCSHFEWQQCGRAAAVALVGDSVQTALRVDRRFRWSFLDDTADCLHPYSRVFGCKGCFFFTCFLQQWPFWSLWLPWTAHWSGVKWDQMPNWTLELNTFSSGHPVQFSAHVTKICRKKMRRPPEIQKVIGITIRGSFLRLSWFDAQLIERLQLSASSPGWPLQ